MSMFSMSATRLFVLASIVTLSACDKAPVPENKPKLRPVKTISLNSHSSLFRRQFPGVVDAAQKATLSFRVTGKLETLDVSEGDAVEPGVVLATLDTTDFKIQLADHQAIYDRARADFNRAEKLVGAGHVSRSDFDKLKASLASAKAQLDATQQKIEYSELKAPFAGHIAKRYVDNYEEVSAQQTIFLLQDTSSLLVRIDLPQSLMINSLEARDNYTLFAEFDAIPNQRFVLTMKEIATVADDITQTYSLTLSMPAVEGRSILPGMSVVVSAETNASVVSEDMQQFYLPGHAVMQDTQGYFVLVLIPEDDETGRVKRSAVVVGAPTPNGIEILSGLQQNEQVIVAGMSKLSDGERVRLSVGQR